MKKIIGIILISLLSTTTMAIDLSAIAPNSPINNMEACGIVERIDGTCGNHGRAAYVKNSFNQRARITINAIERRCPNCPPRSYVRILAAGEIKRLGCVAAFQYSIAGCERIPACALQSE